MTRTRGIPRLYPRLYSQHTIPKMSCPDEFAIGASISAKTGRIGDGGKWTCHSEELRTRPCIVYSFGSHGDDAYERAIKRLAPNCEIHTFDPGDYRSQVGHPDVLTYHRKAVGCQPAKGMVSIVSIAEKLNHTHIDLLKMDIEGLEYGVLDSFFTQRETWPLTVWQLQVEFHPLNPLFTPDSHERRLNFFFDKLKDNGFVPFHKEPNFIWRMGIEVAFMNVTWDREHRTPVLDRQARDRSMCLREQHLQQLQEIRTKPNSNYSWSPKYPGSLANWPPTYTCERPVQMLPSGITLCTEHLDRPCKYLCLLVPPAKCALGEITKGYRCEAQTCIVPKYHEDPATFFAPCGIGRGAHYHVVQLELPFNAPWAIEFLNNLAGWLQADVLVLRLHNSHSFSTLVETAFDTAFTSGLRLVDIQYDTVSTLSAFVSFVHIRVTPLQRCKPDPNAPRLELDTRKQVHCNHRCFEKGPIRIHDGRQRIAAEVLKRRRTAETNGKEDARLKEET